MMGAPASVRRLLITGGLLFDATLRDVPANLLVEDGVIIAVGPGLEVPGTERLDARGFRVTPGFINAHTHSNQALEKGLCDRLPLDQWMVVASYGGAGARLSPRDLYISALVGAIEMLKTGTTTILDCARADVAWLQDGMNAVVQAYIDVGMRANVATQFADLDFNQSLPLDLIGRSQIDGARRAPVAEILQHAEEFIGRWKDRHPRVQPMLGPSSLPRCSLELFEGSADLARRRGVRLQSHLLSAKSQVPLAATRFSGSLVGFLGRIGCLEPWASFAHTIWLSPAEVEQFGGSGAVAVHNPVSNLKLGAGIAPVPALRAAGATVALGTDGASSNDSQNMLETVKATALVHRVTEPPERWPSAADALTMCWDGGAAATGLKIGRIAPGFQADLVLFRAGDLLPAPADQVANQFVYSQPTASARTVIVDGAVVVREGRLVTLDEESIHREAGEIVQRLYSSLPERLRRFEDQRHDLEHLERAVAATRLDFRRTFEE